VFSIPSVDHIQISLSIPFPQVIDLIQHFTPYPRASPRQSVHAPAARARNAHGGTMTSPNPKPDDF
jgi:hypothetical protein